MNIAREKNTLSVLLVMLSLILDAVDVAALTVSEQKNSLQDESAQRTSVDTKEQTIKVRCATSNPGDERLIKQISKMEDELKLERIVFDLAENAPLKLMGYSDNVKIAALNRLVDVRSIVECGMLMISSAKGNKGQVWCYRKNDDPVRKAAMDCLGRVPVSDILEQLCRDGWAISPLSIDESFHESLWKKKYNLANGDRWYTVEFENGGVVGPGDTMQTYMFVCEALAAIKGQESFKEFVNATVYPPLFGDAKYAKKSFRMPKHELERRGEYSRLIGMFDVQDESVSLKTFEREFSELREYKNIRGAKETFEQRLSMRRDENEQRKRGRARSPDVSPWDCGFTNDTVELKNLKLAYTRLQTEGAKKKAAEFVVSNFCSDSYCVNSVGKQLGSIRMPKGGGILFYDDPAYTLNMIAAEAKSGNTLAQYKLGQWLYLNSSDGAKENRLSEGAKVYRFGQLFDASDSSIYEAKRREGLEWLSKSAEGGSGDAMYMLAKMYADGDGVAKDAVSAERFYRKAAEAGNSRARYEVEKIDKARASTRKENEFARKVSKDEAEEIIAKAESNAKVFSVKGFQVGMESKDALNLLKYYLDEKGISGNIEEKDGWYRVIIKGKPFWFCDISSGRVTVINIPKALLIRWYDFETEFPEWGVSFATKNGLSFKQKVRSGNNTTGLASIGVSQCVLTCGNPSIGCKVTYFGKIVVDSESVPNAGRSVEGAAWSGLAARGNVEWVTDTWSRGDGGAEYSLRLHGLD